MTPCYYCEADDEVCKTCIHSKTYEDPVDKISELEKQRDELIRVSLAGFKSIAAISGGLVSDLALMSIKNIEAIASVKGKA